MIDPATAAFIIEILKIVAAMIGVVAPLVVGGWIALSSNRRQSLEAGRLRGKELLFELNRDAINSAKETRKQIIENMAEFLDLHDTWSKADLKAMVKQLRAGRRSILTDIPSDGALFDAHVRGLRSQEQIAQLITCRNELTQPINPQDREQFTEVFSETVQLRLRVEDLNQAALYAFGILLFAEYGVLPKYKIRAGLIRVFGPRLGAWFQKRLMAPTQIPPPENISAEEPSEKRDGAESSE